MKLVYSAEAVADLMRLRDFISEKDPHAAHRVGRKLVKRIEILRQFPRIGRPVERAKDPDTLRDIVFGNYVIRYSLHQETIILLRVWHHFEDR